MDTLIKALVVDDEPPAREDLAYMLSLHPGVETLQAGSLAEARQALEERPQVVFQDVHMPGGDGFQVLEAALELPGPPPLFVFVTAFDHYAIKAFEANAVDYLLKPVAQERLAMSLERVRQRLAQREVVPALPGVSGLPGLPSLHAQALESLDRLLGGLGRPMSRLAVEQGGRIRLVPTSQVVLCEAEDKRVAVLTDQGRLTCHGLPTLCRVEERLAGLPFFRANRGVLVNLERIAEFSPWFGGKYSLVMNDPQRTEVVVSRNRAADFRRSLGV